MRPECTRAEHDGRVPRAQVPADYNPVGAYLRAVPVPETWQGLDVFLTVGAAASAVYAWVNGKMVGSLAELGTAKSETLRV